MDQLRKNIQDFICCASTKSHIINSKSFIQECGRYACDSCISSSDDFFCYWCNITHVKLHSPTPQVVLDLLKENEDELESLIDDKIKYEELKEKLNVEYFRQDFKEKLDIIRNEIDVRVESLKAKLDEYRDGMFNDINETEEYVFQNILNKQNVQILKQKYDNMIIDIFSTYKLKVKQLEEDIKEFHKKLPNVSFLSSEIENTKNMIGKLKILKQELNLNIASCSCDNTIKIWDINSSTCVGTLSGHTSNVNSIIQLSQSQISSCSDDTTIKIWDIITNSCVTTLNGHTSYVSSLIQLSNGNIATCSCDNTIKIWDIKSSACVATLSGHANNNFCVIQLLNGNIASCGYNNEIKIWDINKKTCVATLTGHTSSINCIVQLLNGNIASCSDDKTIKIWDIIGNNCVVTLNGHADSVLSLIELSNLRNQFHC